MNRKLVVSVVAALAIVALLSHSFSKTGLAILDIPREESFNYSVYFCALEDCAGHFVSTLGWARNSVSCAFYAAGDYVFGNLSGLPGAEVVVDAKAKIPAGVGSVKVYRAKSKGIMHSKYCIIDSLTIITGSFNPTKSSERDYNNLIVINSTVLAGYYLENFNSLKPGSNGKASTKKAVMLNHSVVEVYFCPIDYCAGAVKNELSNAKASILFAAYSFTHPEIANELILKAAGGISVSGVFEKSTAGSSYSKDNVLAENGVNVRLEASRRLMHHKFFVIDNETVITGSFNPTRNAAERNDENLIIIRDSAIASLYAGEFLRINAPN